MKQAVFSINLMRAAPGTIEWRKIAAASLVSLILLNCVMLAGLSVTCLLKAGAAKAPSAGEAQDMPALEKNLKQLRAEGAAALKDLNAKISADKNRFDTAPKLGAIARTLPARTWITGLSASSETKSLLIKASYLTEPEMPYQNPIRDWLTELKADGEFGPGLEMLELANSSQSTLEYADLLSFEISARWKLPEDNKNKGAK